ncbi:MAG: hypothetical protein R3B48_29340 [Kofleriaceae bacterium]
MDPHTEPSDVGVFLQRGLRFYGAGQVREAIDCWKYVLTIEPNNALALEYLDAAGTPVEPPQPKATPAPRNVSQMNAVTAADALLTEGRFDDALAALYAAHAEVPEDAEVSRALQRVKQQVTRAYRAELGDLSRTPQLKMAHAVIESIPLSAVEREVVSLVDGIAAFEDIASSSTGGVVPALGALVRLLRRGIISDGAPPQEVAPAAEPRRTLSVVERGSESLRSYSLPRAVPTPVLRIVPTPAEPEPEPVAEPEPPSRARGPLSAPSPHAALVAQAVQAYLRGQVERARELVDECLRVIPLDDATSRREVERFAERLVDRTR